MFGHWEQPADLLTRVSEFLKNSLPAQHHVEVRFLAVENGCKFRQLDRSGGGDQNFRPSGRLLRDLYQGTSALKGAARMVSAGPGSSVGAAGLQHSIDYPFDWIMALPVGSRRADPARPGKAATFQPFYYQGNPVCLYIETRESVGNDPKDFLPFVRLVNSLLAEALRAR